MKNRADASSFLPHPGPLPLGEGVTNSVAGRNGCAEIASGGRSDSLSQRERAGVRENGWPACGITDFQEPIDATHT
jgi:hypothetical protein